MRLPCFLLPYTFCIVLLLSVLSIPALAVDATWLNNPSTNISPEIGRQLVWWDRSGQSRRYRYLCRLDADVTEPIRRHCHRLHHLYPPGECVLNPSSRNSRLTLQGVGIVNNSGSGKRSTKRVLLRYFGVLRHIERCQCDDHQHRSEQDTA